MSANATELFSEMHAKVDAWKAPRTANDGPQRNSTIEAYPGNTFVWRHTQHNVVASKSIDLKWAVANVLHFFAETEEASMLPRYNKYAAKFLTDGRWLGAYGVGAMPGVRWCIEKLRNEPWTRRAVVTMNGYEHEDANRPTCWNLLHFLRNRDEQLEMLVYQRSLHLFNVMPYDTIVLSNVLNYVATAVSMPTGPLRWTVGSLHTAPTDSVDGVFRQRNTSIILPQELLTSPAQCLEMLMNPAATSEFGQWLLSDKEVRT